MSFEPTREQLRGLSRDVAECYGKPHVGAFYATGSAYSHRREEDAPCTVCGSPAQSAHHCPPLSKGRFFLLATKWGRFVLRPALFAVCGDGTTGCHNGFHGGARFRARWVWDSDADAEAWWSGELLKRMAPHSTELYRHGCWEFEDRKAKRKWRHRGAA